MCLWVLHSISFFIPEMLEFLKWAGEAKDFFFPTLSEIN